jgi:hypothetical protein
MTQLSPTNISRTQIVDRIKSLKRSYEIGLIRTPHELQAEFDKMLTEYMTKVGTPTVEWDPIALGEPPSTTKINDFWGKVIDDVMNAQSELDILRASVTLTHNLIKTELLKARNQNAQLDNKLKTLQLYSTVQDNTVSVFGDYFKSTDFTDTPKSTTIDLETSGQISLLKLQSQELMSRAKISVLETSNGFAGNNQEIENPEDAEKDPITEEKDYRFYSQRSQVGKLDAVKDQNPTTWFEYENNLVYPGDKQLAKNFNFTYVNDLNLPGGAKLDWGAGPSGGVLHLNVEIDLQSLHTVNNITYSPFGLRDNKNNPVMIRSASISEDGTEWQQVGQENIWVGTNTSLQALRVGDNISLGPVQWSFSPKSIRYVRFEIEQPNAIDSNIGHLWYKNKDTVKVVERTIPDPATPGEEIIIKETVTTEGARIEGPNPKVSKPWEHYSSPKVDFGTYVQKREWFRGKRWAIGIRDISIGQIRYAQQGTYISKPFRVNGVVDRVAIESDFSIPANFDSDERWIKYYVSPNDGLSWYEISPIQNNFNNVPEIVVFNDPLPVAFREENAAYYQVTNTVESIRVKIVLSRPGSEESASPIVTNYRLKVRRR